MDMTCVLSTSYVLQTQLRGANMARKKKEKEVAAPVFQNVAVFKEDIDMLRTMAASEQRSMARQLTVIIREAVAVRAQA
tara:strand:- start:38 stop:274 length:237 start_codon:yes stop_codon:yes gene_type:complete